MPSSQTAYGPGELAVSDLLELVARALQAEADKWAYDSLDQRFIRSHRHLLARAVLDALEKAGVIPPS